MPRRASPRKTGPRATPEGATAKRDPEAPRPVAPTAAQAQRARIEDQLRGFHATHLLAFGQETGAFQQIAQAGAHGITAAELSERAGWFPPYTQWFLEACYALGTLDLASEAGVTPRARYRFAPHMDAILTDEQSPDYMGLVPRLNVLIAQDYPRLPGLFRAGKTYPYALHGEDFLRTSASATRSLPTQFLSEALPRLPTLRKRLEDGAHVLDVGCGAGWAIVGIAEEFPRCRVVGVDAEPNAIEMAKTLLVFRQLQKRADARLVRGEELDYEAEFDVATLFLVLHTIPGNQKRAALTHVHRALKKKGLLVLLEETYPESPEEFRDPSNALTVVNQWIEGPWGHRFATRSELQTLLDGTGFRNVGEARIGRHHVLLAEKA